MQNTFLDLEFQGRRIPLALPPIAFGKNIICDFGKRKGWVMAAVISPLTLSWQREQVHFAKKCNWDRLGGATGGSCLRSESIRWFSLGSKIILEE